MSSPDPNLIPEGTLAPAEVLLPARSRRQAMDWSLALASQGIAVTIVHEPAGPGWALSVPAAEAARARETVRLYQEENRVWRWLTRERADGPRFDWRALGWLLLLVLWHGVAVRTPGVVAAGCMESGAFARGEWWRLFTAVTLHGDVAHLAANVTTGLLLLGLALARYGVGPGLLAAYLAGVAGNLGGACYYVESYRSLGASGMVLGALGLAVVRPAWDDALPWLRRKRVTAALSVGIMLFLLLGANPASDLAAHLGGFAAGLALGFGLQRGRWWRSPAGDRLCLTTLVVLLLLTWTLALARG